MLNFRIKDKSLGNDLGLLRTVCKYLLSGTESNIYLYFKYKRKFIKFFFHEKVLHEKTGCGGSGDGTNILVTVER